jgi:hypothetical protein
MDWCWRMAQPHDFGSGVLAGADLRRTWEVLAASPLGGESLLRWRNFLARLPFGMSFDDLEALDYRRRVSPVNPEFLGLHMLSSLLRSTGR